MMTLILNGLPVYRSSDISNIVDATLNLVSVHRKAGYEPASLANKPAIKRALLQNHNFSVHMQTQKDNVLITVLNTSQS
jgi:hypothetical protein